MDSKLKIYLRGLGIGIVVTALILAISGHNKKNSTMTDAEIITRAQELGMVNGNSYSLTDAENDKNGADSQTDSTQGDSQDASQNNQSQDTSNGAGESSGGQTADGQSEDGQSADNQSEDGQSEDGQSVDNQSEDGQSEVDQPADGQSADGQGESDAQGEDSSQGTDASQNTDASQDTGDAQAADDKTGEEVSITVVAGSSSETLASSLKKAGLIEDSKDFNTYMVNNGYSTRIRVGTFKIPMGSTYEEICKIVTGAKK